jgi:hypothetical protein
MSIISTNDALFKQLLSVKNKVQVSQSVFDHFANIHPPIDTGDSYFVFRSESGDKIIFFIETGNKYYCYLLTDTLYTSDHLISVKIERTSIIDDFTVIYVLGDGDDSFGVGDEFSDFIGQSFATPDLVSEALSLSLA